MSEKYVKEFEKKMDYLKMDFPHQEVKQKFDKEKSMYRKITDEKVNKRVEQLVEVYNANIELYCAPIRLDQYKNLINKDSYVNPKIANKINALIYTNDDLFSYIIENVNLIMDVFLNDIYVDRKTLEFCKQLEDAIKFYDIKIDNKKILNNKLFNNYLSIEEFLIGLPLPVKDNEEHKSNKMKKLLDINNTPKLYININKDYSLLCLNKINSDLINILTFIENTNINNLKINLIPEEFRLLDIVGRNYLDTNIEITNKALDNLEINYIKLESFNFYLINKNEYESKMTKNLLLEED